MSDLINRKELWKAFATKFDHVCSLGEVRKTIDSVPTAEPKVGEWLDAGWDGEKCSLCGYSISDTYYSAQFNYCPNCGAKMERSE